MSNPRGSAAYWNDTLKHVIERSKEMTDHLMEMVGQSGYPPLTVPVTLRDLKKKPQAEAEVMLREELGRTTTKDPVSGEARVDPKTLQLIIDYMTWVRDQAGVTNA